MESKLTEAEVQQSALIQMYQAGFLDGRKAKDFTKVAQECKKCFELRFIKRIQKGVNNVRRNKN
jgi:hypothetical protein